MEKRRSEEPSLFENPVFTTILLVIAGISILANIILAVLMAR
jgi:hypothetical protein